jgi:hypothetical protein
MFPSRHRMGFKTKTFSCKAHLSATPPDRSASFERPRLGHQALRRSLCRLVTLTSPPDTSACAASSGAKTKETSSKIARRRLRVERSLNGLEPDVRLARANPGKVASAYDQKRARLLKECKNQYLEGVEKSRIRSVIPDPHFDDSLSNFDLKLRRAPMEIEVDK